MRFADAGFLLAILVILFGGYQAISIAKVAAALEGDSLPMLMLGLGRWGLGSIVVAFVVATLGRIADALSDLASPDLKSRAKRKD